MGQVVYQYYIKLDWKLIKEEQMAITQFNNELITKTKLNALVDGINTNTGDINVLVNEINTNTGDMTALDGRVDSLELSDSQLAITDALITFRDSSGNEIQSIRQGNQNTAIGNNSLSSNTTGNQNTAIGINSLSSNKEYNNCSGLGYNAQVSASNQVQLGDSSTATYVYGTVQNRSDKRDKTDITPTQLGLDFILKLTPVDYKWDMREDYIEYEETEEGRKIKVDIDDVVRDGSKKHNRNHSGFIAQEVKEVIDELGVDFGGYQDHSINGGKDVLSLGYDEFIAPMVKAIQELTTMVKDLQAEVESLKSLPTV